jgi:hypothetical protein
MSADLQLGDRCEAIIRFVNSTASKRQKFAVLVSAMRDADVNVQRVAIIEARCFQDKQIQTELVRLASQSGANRRQALVALAKCNAKRAIAICDQLIASGDRSDLFDASMALAAANSHESTARLLKLVDKVDKRETQRVVAIALAERGYDSIEAELESFLPTATPDESVVFAVALTRLGNATGAKLLRNYLSNEDFPHRDLLRWTCHRVIGIPVEAPDWKDRAHRWVTERTSKRNM